MQPLTEQSFIYSGSEGGRCGLEEGVEDCLRELAKAGNGRFHHFKASGSCDSDDISELKAEMAQALEYLEEGRRILDDYREFCRRVCSVAQCILIWATIIRYFLSSKRVLSFINNGMVWYVYR